MQPLKIWTKPKPGFVNKYKNTGQKPDLNLQVVYPFPGQPFLFHGVLNRQAQQPANSSLHKAISNTIQNTGVFKGRKITEYQPKPGDILHNNRSGNSYEYEYAKTHSNYESHSAIIIEVGEDNNGKYALTIGGNEGDSIRVKEIRLDKIGFVKQRKGNPFISIIENLK